MPTVRAGIPHHGNNINFPPNARSATIAKFLLYKSGQSVRPESMLKSIRAAVTQNLRESSGQILINFTKNINFRIFTYLASSISYLLEIYQVNTENKGILSLI